MFLPENLIALPIFLPLDTCLLPRFDMTVSSSLGLCPVHARLPSLQIRDFFIGELPGLYALLNAILLIDIPLHVGLHALRRG